MYHLNLCCSCPAPPLQVEKEVAKCQRLMDELDEEVVRKKEVSRKVKELRAQISAYDHEATQLAATQQHLKRQQASLLERIQRLEHQVSAAGSKCSPLCSLS